MPRSTASPTTAAAGATQLVTTSLPTTGCGKAPPIAAGRSANQTIEVDGLRREYRLHMPAGYTPGQKVPLVLLFHGHNATAAVFERITGFSKLADDRTFIAVYPQGRVGPDGRTGWNTSRRKDPKVDDQLFVSDLLTQLQAELCVDSQRIYAAGFSNGGGFTAVLACDFANRIAAFASVSGEYYPQPNGCAPARPVPLIDIHGTADRIVPYRGSRRLRYPAVSTWLQEWAARNGCTASPNIFYQQGAITGQAWARCAGNSALVQYIIAGGTHVWPGSSFQRALRSPDKQLNATAVIWSFFDGRTLR
ncbi:MAG: alpha/beta hydrolase family esterase [Ktedonobacterales bacterium]